MLGTGKKEKKHYMPKTIHSSRNRVFSFLGFNVIVISLNTVSRVCKDL